MNDTDTTHRCAECDADLVDAPPLRESQIYVCQDHFTPITRARKAVKKRVAEVREMLADRGASELYALPRRTTAAATEKE